MAAAGKGGGSGGGEGGGGGGGLGGREGGEGPASTPPLPNLYLLPPDLYLTSALTSA